MGLLSVPLKTILPYHADLQNETLPETYALCNGQTLTSTQQDINPGGSYTLPDLRNVFLLGADITKGIGVSGGLLDAPSDAPGPKGVGGQHSKSLAISELPSHVHSGTIANAGSHAHSGSTTSQAGDHTHPAQTTTAGAHAHAGSSTSTTGAHTHAGSTTSVSGSHAHTITDPGHQHSIYIFQHSYQAPGGMATQDFAGTPLFDNGIRTTTNYTNIGIVANGDHTHILNITSDGGHAHTLTLVSDGDHTHPVSVTNSGNHIHSLSLVSDGDHTHSFTGTATGGGQAFDTRPRFYGVVYIMKVKI